MPTRRIFLAGGICAVANIWATPLIAAEPTAKEFLDRIYQTYVGKDAPGILVDKPANIRSFTPALRKLMAADATEAEKRGGVGNLDGDPLVDAQEWDIKSFTVAVYEAKPGQAKGTVRFKNFDKDVTIRLDLVKTSGEWHIDEIVGPSGSLRALLTRK
jgi:hypothetical protein